MEWFIHNPGICDDHSHCTYSYVHVYVQSDTHLLIQQTILHQASWLVLGKVFSDFRFCYIKMRWWPTIKLYFKQCPWICQWKLESNDTRTCLLCFNFGHYVNQIYNQETPVLSYYKCMTHASDETNCQSWNPQVLQKKKKHKNT